MRSMSLTIKQINELRAYAKDRKGELAKMINDAADTIEMLLAKLLALQKEFGVQSWVLCKNQLPKIGDVVLITNSKGNVKCGQYRGVEFKSDNNYFWTWRASTQEQVVAWMPLPKPYKKGKDI